MSTILKLTGLTGLQSFVDCIGLSYQGSELIILKTAAEVSPDI